ncbi:MAG: heparan-alpha-glucosaminide N-acetyltransferase domain-containing protein [Bryobacteraceae bacterium]|jgi:predicted acyltransferase
MVQSTSTSPSPVAQVSPKPSAETTPARLISLDAFRGATMALMVLVNTPGGPNSYGPLNHSEWNGWTITDTVFPSFLWIVGVAITLSLGPRIEAGVPKSRLFLQALRRAAVIFGLGLIVYAAPNFNWSTQRLLGVLQRIAICYLIASAIYLTTRWRFQVVAIVALLVSYWLVMMLAPVPGYGAGDLAVGHNFANYVDRVVLGAHNYANTKSWDPEGLISTLPAIATALLGVMAGYILKLKRDLSERTTWLYLTGSILIALGLICDIWLPINKKLWTSSFTLFMAGMDFVIFAGFVWLIDGRGYRRIARPLAIMGMNAIAVYMASELVEEALGLIHVAGPASPSVHAWIYQNLFAPLASARNASLAYAICYVLLMYAIAYGMYRKRWFLRA